MIARSFLLMLFFFLSSFTLFFVQLGCNLYGSAHYYMYAEIYSLGGEYALAIVNYTKSIELQPDYAAAYYGRGWSYYKQKNYDKAIVDYNTAIELSLNDALIYVSRGDAYRMKKDYDRSIADYTRAIELQPDFVDAYCKRSIVHSEKGNHDKAIADGTKARELKPNNVHANLCNALAYDTSGIALLDKEEYDKAMAHLTIAIELYSFARDVPKRSDDYSSDGTSLANKLVRSTVLEVETYLADAFFARASIYLIKGDYDKAITDCSQTIELQPDNYVFLRTRGDIYFELGNYNQAIADYSRLIELQPTDDSGYNLRGKAHQAKGDADLAKADFAVAEQLRSAQ